MRRLPLNPRTAAAGAAGAAAWLLTRELIRERARCRRALAERDAARRAAGEEIAAFASLAAHDLRSPLRRAAAFAERLRERLDGGLDAASRDLLERLLRSVSGMEALVEGLAALTRAAAPSGPREDLDPGKAAEEALAELRPEIEACGARVRVYALPRVRAEPEAVTRLFVQLLSNALKFRHPGRAPDICVRGERLPGGQVELRVEDDGVGFDAASAGKLFTPFGRLHSAFEFPGAGLGLAACRRLVERQGGAMAAESGPAGTVVRVRLPGPQEGTCSRA